MIYPSKTITLAAIILALFAITYIACNKDNNPTATTIIKCVTCANGGSCINDTCRCPAGYTGTSCQTLAIQQFLGEWTVNEKGSVTGFQSYNISIEQNGTAITSVMLFQLYNPYLSFTSSTLTANINGDSIFIPTQSLDSGYITGKGIFQANITGGQNTITVWYQVTNTITGITNDFGYSNPADNPSVWTFQP